MADPTELAQWIAASADGDQRAFQRLYQATSPHLYGLLLRILKTEDRASDALQDAFVKIWEKAHTYAPERGAPITWLMSIARNRALDLLRRRRPEVPMPEDADMQALLLVDENAAGPDRDNETLESLAAVQRCLGALQDEQRDSIMYAYYEGMTHAEIANRMQAPLGTVKSWVRRGLLRLRECLDSRSTAGKP